MLFRLKHISLILMSRSNVTQPLRNQRRSGEGSAMAARRKPGYLRHIASTSCLVIVGERFRRKMLVTLCNGLGFIPSISSIFWSWGLLSVVSWHVGSFSFPISSSCPFVSFFSVLIFSSLSSSLSSFVVSASFSFKPLSFYLFSICGLFITYIIYSLEYFYSSRL